MIKSSAIPMPTLAFTTLTDLAAQIRSRQISPVAVTRHMLDRIAQHDPTLHAYVTVMHEQALAEIARGQYRGPLHGVPLALKDLCFTYDAVTTCGSYMLANWQPDHDGTVVRKLKQAGAIIIGKTHLTEFALRWHHPYRPAPCNVWDAARWPGVSSSGSGVAAAAGLCYGAIGTDTGGSIRFPAAANGIVGLKPTYGRVSRAGVFPLAASLDHIGPLTRSVADAAAILQAIAGADALDPSASHLPIDDYVAACGRPIAGLRIGIDQSFAGDDAEVAHGVQPRISAAIKSAVRVLAQQGAHIVMVNVPEPDPIATQKAWMTLTGEDALVAHADFYPARANEYGPFRELLDGAARQSAADYAHAHALREDFTCRFNHLFEQIDVLLCPTMPTTAPLMDANGLALMQTGYVRTRYTYPINFSRNPTLSQPCGFDDEGLPISLQWVGRHFDEATLCQVGHAYEQATAWHSQVAAAMSARYV